MAESSILFRRKIKEFAPGPTAESAGIFGECPATEKTDSANSSKEDFVEGGCNAVWYSEIEKKI